MGGRLLYRDGNGRDASVDIAPEGCFLGRGADCAVRTDDAMVSRKNCKISFAGGRWTVEDLGSSNGTFVNEVRIQKQPLNHADVVRCGTLQVRFVETADAVPQGAGGPAAATGKPKTMSIPAQGGGSVQVDPALQQAFAGGGGLNPAALMQQKDYELQQAMQEREMLAARLREASQELEAAQHRNDGNQTELQRLRAENLGYRDRLGELQREKSLQDDEIHALTKVGNELREELEALKGDHLTNKQRVEELTDEMQARERQLERAHEDVQRAKQMMEEMRGKLAEVGKTKDEGWKELNARIAELDQLREVIAEQERILEERKVGLMSLETAVKDMRAEKERNQREFVQLKNERDELRDKIIRQNHQIEALEEEQRRLARMLADGGSGGGGGDNSEHVRLATEVRELKVELRKAETERTRFQERLESTERERAELDEKLSRVDIERASAVQSKGTIDAARARLEEKLAKAEAARVKAEEALAEAQKAKETSDQAADRAKVEADREKKRATELEMELKATREAAAGATPAMLAEASHPQLVDSTSEIQVPAEARVHQLEEEVARLEKELSGHAPSSNGQIHEIKKKAEEAYSGINDALSELRTNILLAKDLVAEHGKAVPDHDAARTLEDAINVSVDRTEDAKGLLRALREVIES
ncbi:MAG TPA: FHA domain-containing protein [Polyangia bacterium]|nr:FHA domain-containing protein [Polyangia bacterium]